jgi:hypothetical protein
MPTRAVLAARRLVTSTIVAKTSGTISLVMWRPPSFTMCVPIPPSMTHMMKVAPTMALRGQSRSSTPASSTTPIVMRNQSG